MLKEKQDSLAEVEQRVKALKPSSTTRRPRRKELEEQEKDTADQARARGQARRRPRLGEDALGAAGA